jgi:hypothetical protein
VRYKRAFFVVFVILVCGLGLWWYSSNQINEAAANNRLADFQWFQYEWYGMLIFMGGVALFVFFTGIAVKNWIGM